MIYRFNCVVTECRERSQIIASWLNHDKDVEVNRVSLGWWLTLDNAGGDLSFALGLEKPEPLFRKGDAVILTIAPKANDA